MRALLVLIVLALLAAPVPLAVAQVERGHGSAKPAAQVSKATGRISKLSRSRITVAGLSCTRGPTSPGLRGLTVGARVGISCKSGVLTRIAAVEPAPSSAGTATAAAAGAAQVPAAPAPSPPSCPDYGYRMPSVLTLTQPGLTKVVDAPHVYPVTGNTVAEVNAQIAQCRPQAAGRYSAVTTYALSYSFTSARQAGGLCRLTRISVGIHVAVALPGWTPGPGAAPGLAEAWQSYIAALSLHEQGHVDRDLASAQQLLDDLSALGEVDCGHLGIQVGTMATKAGVALAQSNVDFDTQTAHGRNQGAILQ